MAQRIIDEIFAYVPLVERLALDKHLQRKEHRLLALYEIDKARGKHHSHATIISSRDNSTATIEARRLHAR